MGGDQCLKARICCKEGGRRKGAALVRMEICEDSDEASLLGTQDYVGLLGPSCWGWRSSGRAGRQPDCGLL